jgi:hypothetical protein
MTTAVVDRPSTALRFAACPECADRRRLILESPEGLLGRCLGCGRRLDAPLATERLAAWAAVVEVARDR